MSKGYDILLKDGDTTIRVLEVTGCRCGSCEDFVIDYDDHDEEDPRQESLLCYKYGTGDKDRDIYHQTIDALARRVAELEEALKSK